MNIIQPHPSDVSVAQYFVIDKSSSLNENYHDSAVQEGQEINVDLITCSNSSSIENNGNFVVPNNSISEPLLSFDIDRSSNTNGACDSKCKKTVRLGCSIDSNDLYINITPRLHPNKKLNKMQQLLTHKSDGDIMDKCVMKPGFEKLHEVPPYTESIRQLKKKRKIEREKTKGDDWYHLPTADQSEEHKNDLKVLHMRKAINPNSFYKSNDTQAPPKYCEFGKIVETAADFYSSRLTRKQRKQTIADELLSDSDFMSYGKRKIQEISDAKRQGTGPYALKREREKKRDRKKRLKRQAKLLKKGQIT